MKKRLTILVSGLAIAGAVSLTLPSVLAQPPVPPPPGAGMRAERHPRIRAAIRALEEAKKEMQEADHDFGGHRVEALAECDKAIAQLKLALQYDKK